MKKKAILFVIPKFVNIGIISSQHLVLLKKLSSHSVVHIAIPKKFNKIALENKLEEDKIIWFDSYSELSPILKNYTWIYIRSLYTFIFIYLNKITRFRKFKIFYDFRALSYLEVKYVQNNWVKNKFFFITEFFAYHFSDARGAVSNRLAAKLTRAFGKKPIYVVPCCIESVKPIFEVMFKKQQLANKRSQFVYVGSINKWQCFEDTLYIFNKIAELIPAELTVITRDKIKAIALLNKILPVNNIKVFSLSHEEVMEMMPTFDFGFLIREDSPINNYASPVKFLEYTSNGVIPIMTKNIGDYSEIVRTLDLGIVLDSNWTINHDQLLKKVNDDQIVARLLYFSADYLFDKYMDKHPLSQL